jgi:WD40 repeat protein
MERTSHFFSKVDARCCSYDSTSRLLAIGIKSGSIDLVDLKSQTMKKKSYKIMENSVINCLAWSKNDRYIATGNANGSIVVFNTLVNQISKPWISPFSKSLINNSVSCLQYSPGNVANLASAYEDGSVILWDSAKESPIASFKNHTSLCTSVVISSVNQVLMISGGLDSVISLYDTAKKKVLKTIQCNAGVTSIDLLKDGATLAVGQINGDVNVFDLRAKVDEPLLSKKCHDTSVFCVKFVQKTSYNMIPRANSGTNVNSLPVSMSSLEPSNSTSIKKSSSYNQDLHNNTTTQLNAPSKSNFGYSKLNYLT